MGFFFLHSGTQRTAQSYCWVSQPKIFPGQRMDRVGPDDVQKLFPRVHPNPLCLKGVEYSEAPHPGSSRSKRPSGLSVKI